VKARAGNGRKFPVPVLFLREASRENKVWITLGMFCTECAEKNYVFHKRKKRRGKIVDNGKEKSGFCV
jgi:hypothetical protein